MTERVKSAGLWKVLVPILCGVVVVAIVWPRRSSSVPPRVPPLPDRSRLEKPLVRRLEALTREVEADPRSAAKWGRLGVVLDVHELYPEAITCYEEAERLDPEDFRWPYFLGVCKRLGDQTAALEHFTRAAELNRDYAPIQIYLGESSLRTEDFDAARAAFARAAALDETLVRARIGLAKVALNQSDLDGARTELERAVSLGPRAGEAFWMLADVYRRLGRAEDADRVARQAAGRQNLEPFADPVRDGLQLREGVTLRWRRERCAGYRRQGELGKVVEEWQAAARDEPDSIAITYELGRAYAESGRLEEARGQLERVIDEDPEHANAHQDLGVVLLGLGERDRARQAFTKALDLNPELHAAKGNLGSLLMAAGETERGIGYLREAAEAQPRSAAAAFNLAMALRDHGTPEEAAAWFKTCVEIDRSNVRALFEYGALLGRMEQHLEAARVFQAVAALEPTRLVAHLNRARELERAGRFAEAIEAYQEGIAHHPEDVRLKQRLAWLLATCPDPRFRDGPKVVSIASKLCESSNHRNAGYLDLLAAGYAEMGDFESAARFAQQAFEILRQSDPRDERRLRAVGARLGEYQRRAREG